MTSSPPRMPTYFVVASTVERRGDCRWPYEIAFAFEEGLECPVGFAEGIGQGVGAITESAAEALRETWRKHFEATDSRWLLPHLEALAGGSPLSREEIFATYRFFHGRDPEPSLIWS